MSTAGGDDQTHTVYLHHTPGLTPEKGSRIHTMAAKTKKSSSGKSSTKMVYYFGKTKTDGNGTVITSYSIHYTKLYDISPLN